MKRVLCLILAFFLVIPAVVPVRAVEAETSMMPRYSYIGRIYSGLSIGTLGLSACQANCHAEAGDSVVLTAKLQQYNGSTWTTLKTWSATGEDFATLSKNYAVPKGYTYRLSASCSVYSASGVLLESGICHSNYVVYYSKKEVFLREDFFFYMPV